jgi:hypothetical protein
LDEIRRNLKYVHTCIFKLEQGYKDRQDIVEAYNDICNIIKKEMYDKINFKTVMVKNSNCNKKGKVGKPWWSEHLSCLWNGYCEADNNWLKCTNISQKRE